MATMIELVDPKAQLEERIRTLEEERTALMESIAMLKERVTNLELERQASSLTNEVEALRTEKAVLEEKIASYGPSPASPVEAYQV